MNWPSLIMAFHVLVLPGLCFIRKAIQLFVFGRRSMTWPTVIGKISSPRIVMRSMGKNRPLCFIPEVWYQYQYTVGHVVHKSRHINIGITIPDFDKTQDKIEVLVYYDPKKPSRSVLEPGIKFMPAIFYLVAGVIFLGGGLIALYLEATGQMR